MAPYVGNVHPYSRGFHALIGQENYRGDPYVQYVSPTPSKPLG